jgi:hypothetical protein
MEIMSDPMMPLTASIDVCFWEVKRTLLLSGDEARRMATNIGQAAGATA